VLQVSISAPDLSVDHQEIVDPWPWLMEEVADEALWSQPCQAARVVRKERDWVALEKKENYSKVSCGIVQMSQASGTIAGFQEKCQKTQDFSTEGNVRD
jgi:hypothetical protein